VYTVDIVTTYLFTRLQIISPAKSLELFVQHPTVNRIVLEPFVQCSTEQNSNRLQDVSAVQNRRQLQTSSCYVTVLVHAYKITIKWRPKEAIAVYRVVNMQCCVGSLSCIKVMRWCTAHYKMLLFRV